MSVLEMYNEFREKFPKTTEKTDNEHIKFWGDIDPDFCYSWFESLAKTINLDMAKEVDPNEYKEVFEFLRSRFLQGDEKMKDCIDVSFTENLFWKIPFEKAQPYWTIFPDLLKGLYVNFHKRTPG